MESGYPSASVSHFSPNSFLKISSTGWQNKGKDHCSSPRKSDVPSAPTDNVFSGLTENSDEKTVALVNRWGPRPRRPLTVAMKLAHLSLLLALLYGLCLQRPESIRLNQPAGQTQTQQRYIMFGKNTDHLFICLCRPQFEMCNQIKSHADKVHIVRS